MKKLLLLLLLALSFSTVACAAPDEAGNNDTAVSNTTTNNNETAETQPIRLDEAYDDALPIMTQLALGTIQLDETELAVDEALAAELIPLWQAAQSLSDSDTAASAEVTAVLNQIQDSMSPEQVAAIADMALTEETLTALLESGTITFGRGAGQGQGQAGEGRIVPPGGIGQGGGPGGGGPGGLGGRGGGNLSEDDIATRQAQIASGEVGGVQEQALVGAVVRLLQTKTGEAAPNPDEVADTVFTAVSQQLGLTPEELQAQLTDGTTLVAVIEANDGDVTAVREAIVTSLNGLENAEALDVEQIVNNWLNE